MFTISELIMLAIIIFLVTSIALYITAAVVDHKKRKDEKK